MALKRAPLAVGVLIGFAFPYLFTQGPEKARPSCEAPAYFGICDPFVPGIIVGIWPGGRVRVRTTWPDGPADEAGLCPGDEIVGANTGFASGGTLDQFLRAVVSDKPGTLDLKVKRGDQDLAFRLSLVRESTLAALSKQRFAVLPLFPAGNRLVTVPLDESSEEVEAFRNALLHLGGQYGFMLVGDEWVPQGTPQGNLQQLAQIRSPYSASQSSVSLVVFVGATTGAGFTALAAPKLGEVVVDKVVPTSPAYRAGLYPGDRLLEVDGRSVQGLGPQQLADLVVKPDGTSREVTLQVRRGESLVDVRLQTQRMEEFAYFLTILGPVSVRGKRAPACKVGLDVFVADGPRQVIVTGVDYPSPAFKEGLHVGDLILAANGRPVEQIGRAEWSDLLNPAASSRLALEISRLDRKLAFLVPAVTEAEAQAEIGRSMTKDGPASPHCGEPPKPN